MRVNLSSRRVSLRRMKETKFLISRAFTSSIFLTVVLKFFSTLVKTSMLISRISQRYLLAVRKMLFASTCSKTDSRLNKESL